MRHKPILPPSVFSRETVVLTLCLLAISTGVGAQTFTPTSSGYQVIVGAYSTTIAYGLPASFQKLGTPPPPPGGQPIVYELLNQNTTTSEISEDTQSYLPFAIENTGDFHQLYSKTYATGRTVQYTLYDQDTPARLVATINYVKGSPGAGDGTVKITYRFYQDRMVMSVEPLFIPDSTKPQNIDRTIQVTMRLDPSLASVQASPRPPTDSIRLSTSGLTYSLPYECFIPKGNGGAPRQTLSPMREMRFFCQDGAGIDFRYDLNGNLNSHQNGQIFSYFISNSIAAVPFSLWGRGFSSPLVEFTFAPVNGQSTGLLDPSLTRNPVPSFSVTPDTASNPRSGYGLLAHDAPNWNFQIRMARRDLDANGQGIYYHLDYKITDYWGQPVTNGTSTFRSSDLVSTQDLGLTSYITELSVMPPLQMNEPLKGYYHLICSIVPDGANTTSTLPNQAETDFGVYTYLLDSEKNTTPVLYNAEKPISEANRLEISDPGIAQVLGLASVRIEESKLNPTFPTTYGGRVDPFLHFLLGTSPDIGINPKDTTLFGSILPHFDPDGHPIGGDDFFKKVRDIIKAYRDNPAPYTTFRTPFNYWSLTNEPGGTASAYIDTLLIPGSQGVLEAYKGNKDTLKSPYVIAPNLVRLEQPDAGSNVPFSWFDHFVNNSTNGVANSGSKYLDGFGMHTYTGDFRSYEEHGTIYKLQNINRIINNYATATHTPAKPLWITEHAWGNNWHDEMPRLFAAYQVRGAAIVASNGVPFNRTTLYHAPGYTDTDNYHLWDGAPNPGGMAMRIYAEMIANMSYSGKLFADYPALPNSIASLSGTWHEYVHGYIFQGGGNKTLMVWGDDFTDPKLLPSGQNPMSVSVRINSSTPPDFRDCMGNKITVPLVVAPDVNTPPYYIIPATSSPVYVKVPDTATFQNVGELLQKYTNYCLSQYGGTVNTTASTPVASSLAGGTFLLPEPVVILPQ